MAFSPRNIVGCLLKKRLTKGGRVTGTSGSPLATPLQQNALCRHGTKWKNVSKNPQRLKKKSYTKSSCAIVIEFLQTLPHIHAGINFAKRKSRNDTCSDGDGDLISKG